MKLEKIYKITGKITVLTGLHIGSGNMEIHIGGTDNPIVKHPHTLEPYIPGSSLKGKIRSLLEMESGVMSETKGGVLNLKVLSQSSISKEQKEKCRDILIVFGCSGADSSDGVSGLGPTRVSFSDCFLNKDWKEKAIKNRWQIVEVKTENTIDRIRGTASNPRTIERVPNGAEFDFHITFKVLDNYDEYLIDKVLLRGMRLLEMDSLGGCGSRGYGRIQFNFDDNGIQQRFNGIKF